MERASETELGMEKGKKKKAVFQRESTDLNSKQQAKKKKTT